MARDASEEHAAVRSRRSSREDAGEAPLKEAAGAECVQTLQPPGDARRNANERSVFGGEDMSVEVLARANGGMPVVPPPPATGTYSAAVGAGRAEPSSGAKTHRVMSAVPPTRTVTPLAITRIGDWVLDRTLGAGSTAKVKLARHRTTGEVCAVKIIARSPEAMGARRTKSRESTASRERRVFREAAVMHLLDDARIVRLRDFLVTRDHFCMLFEYVDGVQLLDYIVSHGRLHERQARAFFRQLVQAVDYCHAHALVHRDLKIENVLVDAGGRVKLLDFGLANFFVPDDVLRTYCGSLYFAAPELLCGRPYVGPEIDVWSLGVILYVLVVGRVPFDDRSIPVLHEKIKRAHVAIPDTVSPACRDLLLRMLCREPARRATLDDVACHAWTNEGHRSVPRYLAPERMPPETLDERAVALLVHSFCPEVFAGGESEIRGVLETATRDWAAVHREPVVALYFLALDRVAALEDAGSEAPWWVRGTPGAEASVSVAACERSRSTTCIPSDASARSSAHGTASAPMSPPPRAASLSRGHAMSVESAARTDGTQSVSRRAAPIPEDEVLHGTALPGVGAGPGRRHSVSVPSSPRPAVHRHASDGGPLTGAAPREGSRAQDEYLGIKTVYLKGFFSIQTTSSRPAMAIRNELQQFLMRRGIRFEDHRSFFACECVPPGTPRDGEDSAQSTSGWSARAPAHAVRFEVHIVRVALLGGLYGVQLKRVSGDIQHYKTLCSEMLSSIRL